MHQVQLFRNAAEDAINKWLADHPDLDMVDIKLAAGVAAGAQGAQERYTAVMVIYRTKTDEPLLT